jgi:CelD/BcsL family acetyltransferase involved in cellulose biosynthesis
LSCASLKLEIVDDVSRLLGLEQEWSAFAQTIDGLTPFQLPAWLITWWLHFGTGRLRCFLFRHADEMAGFVPCFLHEWNGARQITLLGAGISDYLEPAIRLEYANDMVAQIRRHLEATSDWDLCHWQDLSLDTPLKRLASQANEDAPCMVIPLNGSFEEYWKSCPRSLRQNVRRDRTKAEAHGKVQFDVSREARPELLDALIAMHSARWQRQDQPGMIEANGSAAFLRDIACTFAARDMLRIFSVQFDEKLAAVILAFAYRRRILNYLTAFDPEFERLGFGRTLLYEAVRYSFENGYTVWDFLRGDEPYKHWWRAQTIPKVRIIVTRKG